MQPTHVLFNGGVFRTEFLRQRFLDVMGGWFGNDDIQQLNRDSDLDSAVARGAAYYGWAKQHGGVRIRGGTARSYYIGIETSGLAIPGAPRPLRALCVVPFGMEEGSQLDVPSDEIGLVLGEPVHFRFFSSSTRKQDQPGDVLDRWTEDELQETDSMETELLASGSGEDDYVPVQFQLRVTELGVFELWCVSSQGDDRCAWNSASASSRHTPCAVRFRSCFLEGSRCLQVAIDLWADGTRSVPATAAL